MSEPASGSTQDPLAKPQRDPEVEAAAIAEDSLIFNLTFLIPTATILAIIFAFYIVPSSWSLYRTTVQYWAYPGSVVLPIWYLIYTIGWSIPLTVNFLAWHGIFKDPKPLPLPRVDERNVQTNWTHGNLLAWSVPRVLLYVNISLFSLSGLTVLLSPDLRANDWGCAVAALWGAFMLNWTSSQIHFYARRRFKLLIRTAASVEPDSVPSFIPADSKSNTSSTTATTDTLSTLTQRPHLRPRRHSNVARISTSDRLQRINEILNPAFTDRVSQVTEAMLYVLTFLLFLSTTNLLVRATSSPSPPGSLYALADGTRVHLLCHGVRGGLSTILLDSGLSEPSLMHAGILERAAEAGEVGRVFGGEGLDLDSFLPCLIVVDLISLLPNLRILYHLAASPRRNRLKRTSTPPFSHHLSIATTLSHSPNLTSNFLTPLPRSAIARLLTAAHPVNVTGVVLIDPMHEDYPVRGTHALSLAWFASPVGLDRFLYSVMGNVLLLLLFMNIHRTNSTIPHPTPKQAVVNELHFFRSHTSVELRCSRHHPAVTSPASSLCVTPRALFPSDVPLTIVTTGEPTALHLDLAENLSTRLVALKAVAKPDTYEHPLVSRSPSIYNITVDHGHSARNPITCCEAGGG
ncbi:hypothetical protein BC938DRAFT_472236 [Jimgerdemannia flammicorona]|uniref:Uncharacterized protein n=1 Tax=Jimgerdemannia flammicorona TaxID=994334 RepID=A0A433Q6J0_9FUNG|nr:hypothetical protein BC938DRAFT_472236 [Jimgerdemannia flammicorona]